MKNARPSWALSIICVVLIAGCTAAYWPVLSCGFLNFDDNKYVTENARIHQGLNMANLRWAWTTGYASNWHPLTWTSHMLDCTLFKLNPAGHHAISLGFHLFNVLLLFGFLRCLTGDLWPSVGVAAAFGVHPTHVESVAWIAERKDVLSTFWFLLTLWAYTKYASRAAHKNRRNEDGGSTGSDVPGSAGCRRVTRLWYGLALLCFALGLLSKPMLVTVPFVLLLLDYWPLKRFNKPGDASAADVWLEKAPFFLLSFASCVVTVVVQGRGGAVVPLEVVPLDARCWNAAVSYVRYVGKLVWPHDLAVFYPYHPEWPAWVCAGAITFVLLSAVAAIVVRRLVPFVTIGWFWFLGTLVPVIGIIQAGEQAMADRYTYIPSIGLFVVVAWGAARIASTRFVVQRLLGCLALFLLGVWALETRAQTNYWCDSHSLFEHTVKVTEANPVARNSLGTALMEEGHLDAAIHQFEAALTTAPTFILAHNNLGVALARQGHFDEAVAHYRIALGISANDYQTHYNLANAYNPGFIEPYAVAGQPQTHQADPTVARQEYRTALELNPQFINARINWGNLELAEGNYAVAREQYELALQLDPLSSLAKMDLANLESRTGRIAEAISMYEEVTAIEPRNTTARRQLALLYEQGGRREEALTQFAAIARLEPKDPRSHYDHALELVRTGQRRAAAQCLRESIRLQPNSVLALNNLAWLLATAPEDDLRDGNEAVQLATRACELSGFRDARVLGTLDAAYAEAGSFTNAITTSEQVCKLATTTGQPELVQTASARKKLYQMGKAYRDGR